MDTLTHGSDGDRGVNVIGRGNGHRLNTEYARIVEKFAVVGVERHAVHVKINAVLHETQLGGVAYIVVAVAERDNLNEPRLEHRRPVRISLAHDANDGKLDLLLARRAHATADGESRSTGQAANKSPS